MKKILPTGLTLLIILLFTFGHKYLYKAPRNISEEKATHELTSGALAQEFGTDPNNAMYTDQVLKIHGQVTELGDHYLILDDRIHIDLLNPLSTPPKINDPLMVKGRCVGYDDLLELVKIDQATLITN